MRRMISPRVSLRLWYATVYTETGQLQHTSSHFGDWCTIGPTLKRVLLDAARAAT